MYPLFFLFFPLSLHRIAQERGIAWLVKSGGASRNRKVKEGENVTVSYKGFLLEDYYDVGINDFRFPGVEKAFDYRDESDPFTITDWSSDSKVRGMFCLPDSNVCGVFRLHPAVSPFVSCTAHPFSEKNNKKGWGEEEGDQHLMVIANRVHRAIRTAFV